MSAEKTQAAKRIAHLRREVEEHNRRYHEEAAPTISDRKYDELYSELVDLETRFKIDKFRVEFVILAIADGGRGFLVVTAVMLFDFAPQVCDSLCCLRLLRGHAVRYDARNARQSSKVCHSAGGSSSRRRGDLDVKTGGEAAD